MLSGFVDLILGGVLQLALLLFGLLPSVDVASLPLGVPDSVSGVLSALNWFIPVGDLLSILSVWIGLVLAANVAMIVRRVVSSVKG